MHTYWRILGRGLGIVVLLLVAVALGTVISISSGFHSSQQSSMPDAVALSQESGAVAYPPPATEVAAKPASGEAAYPPPGTPTPLSPDRPYRVIGDSIPPIWDEESLLQSSPIIVYARVAEVQPARWNTADGKRPKDPFANTNEALLYTPVRLEMIEVLKGKPQSPLIFNIGGGTVGQDSAKMLPEDQYVFQVGQQVVLYFAEGVSYMRGELFGFNKRYTITADGQAQDGTERIPLEELLASIRKAVSKP